MTLIVFSYTKKKKNHKYKIIKKLCFYFFVIYLYWTHHFQHYKLTYLTQKVKNLDYIGHVVQNLKNKAIEPNILWILYTTILCYV